MLFENVIKEDGKKSKFPIVTNLYAHPQRISWALGLNSQSELRQFGKLLAFLKNPEPPSSIKETFSMLPIAKRILSMSPKNVKKAVQYMNPGIKNTNKQLYGDLWNNFELDQSNRLFYSTANTRVANDQGAFAQFLYNDLKYSGKESTPEGAIARVQDNYRYTLY